MAANVQADHKDCVPHRTRDEFLPEVRAGGRDRDGARAPRESLREVKAVLRGGGGGRAFIKGAERDQSVVPVRRTCHRHINRIRSHVPCA